MSTIVKMAIVGGLMAAIGTVVVLKNGGTSTCCPPATHPPGGAGLHDEYDEPVQTAPSPSGLPRLVELGSTTCIPCQMMKPILEELTSEYDGRLEVQFVDVHQEPAKAEQFKVRVIPTQVFLDADGSELFRHEGFFPKEDILAKWAQLGFDFVQP